MYLRGDTVYVGVPMHPMFPQHEMENKVDGVVSKATRTQTEDAQWLCIDNIYHKMNRSGYYDIGGTFSGDSTQYWFNFRSEIFSESHLLHIFVLNRMDTSFSIGLSSTNHFIEESNGDIFLSQTTRRIVFDAIPESKLNYVFTYNFTPFDMEKLKGKKLYIGFKALEHVDITEDMLHHNFESLWLDPVLSDFTIESADGHKFKVHKLILSTQSGVFSAMLKDNTAESQNAYVQLVDVNKEDLHNILEFIYTGTIKDLHNCNCANLMLLADRYDLKDLCELIQYALCELLTVDTVLDILVVADMCNSQYLKMSTLKFIKQHPQTMETKAWKEFNNVELIRLISQHVAPKIE